MATQDTGMMFHQVWSLPDICSPLWSSQKLLPGQWVRGLPQAGVGRNRLCLSWELHRSPPRVEEVLPSQIQTVRQSVEEAANGEMKHSRMPWGKVIQIPQHYCCLFGLGGRLGKRSCSATHLFSLCIACYVLLLAVNIC